MAGSSCATFKLIIKMLATLMGPDATILRARRDENALRRRRPGTGRTTTKRSFGLKLPTALHGLIGRKTGLPLKENVARDVHNLDDVGAFWRDSLEGGLVDKTAASPPTAPIPDPADDLQMKEVQDGAVSATPRRWSETSTAPFRTMRRAPSRSVGLRGSSM